MALPTATALDIINEAFRDVGIKGTGRNLTAEDISTGLRRLNWLISQWNQKKIFIYHMVELSLTSTGALSYTCGPGGDFPFVDAPRKMDSAFVRLINSGIPVDRSLGIIQSKEDYNRISLKSMGTIPSWMKIFQLLRFTFGLFLWQIFTNFTFQCLWYWQHFPPLLRQLACRLNILQPFNML